MKLLFDEVVRRAPETPEPAPGPAKCWKIDGKTFTITLNDARFSAGSDLTAGDVASASRPVLAEATASPRQAYFLATEETQDVSGIPEAGRRRRLRR